MYFRIFIMMSFRVFISSFNISIMCLDGSEAHISLSPLKAHFQVCCWPISFAGQRAHCTVDERTRPAPSCGLSSFWHAHVHGCLSSSFPMQRHGLNFPPLAFLLHATSHPGHHLLHFRPLPTCILSNLHHQTLSSSYGMSYHHQLSHPSP